MEIRKILVPVDGSPLAETAVDHAVDLALKPGASLVLLRAAEAQMGFPPADPVEAQVTAVREAEEYLVKVAERVRRAGVANVETSVWYGAPATAIVEAASFQHPDLIVMTTHGRSGLGRMILGSVAESVLRSTTTPILLVRTGNAPIEPPRGGEAKLTLEPARR
jgi:nucleotide-binding universal stress UspA family protein